MIYKSKFIRNLEAEFDEKFCDWLVARSPLTKAIDELEDASNQLMAQSNDKIYKTMNPYAPTGLSGRWMEETFGFATRTLPVPYNRSAK